MALENSKINEHAGEFMKIIEELTVALTTDLSACDLKWTLFVAAAQSYRYDSQLKPFPPAYQNESTVNIDELLNVINRTPPLRFLCRLLVDKNEQILRNYRKVLQLLHWNLVTVANPCLKTVDKTKVSSEHTVFVSEYDVLLFFSSLKKS